jgi:DtxR family Mn-dependent transcriptional regulator
MPTSTVEDYIKRIYLEQQRSGGGLVSFGRLASAMEVVPGTVTTMVKALADANLVAYEPRQGVRLTESGEKLALHVLRRHRLLELFLVKVLQLDWSEVHGEAEQLEHAVSDLVLERMDALLGHPGFDPHGDPIPSAAGRVVEPKLHSLVSARAGETGSIARITDQDARFLRYATEQGLMPGARIRIESTDPVGDSVTIRLGGGSLTLGRAAAAKILIESQPDSGVL